MSRISKKRHSPGFENITMSSARGGNPVDAPKPEEAPKPEDVAEGLADQVSLEQMPDIFRLASVHRHYVNTLYSTSIGLDRIIIYISAILLLL